MFRTIRAWIFMVLLPGSLALGSVSIYVPAEQLARRAPIVVEATVERTATGFDPTNQTLATYITLAVDVVHRGPADLEQLVVREPGGSHGSVVHDVDAVPIYTPGERVFVFLEPARDGALRTTGMFYGKYRLDPLAGNGRGVVRRELGGQGRIFGGPADKVETIDLGELSELVRTVRPSPPRAGTRPPGQRPATGPGRAWVAIPREFDQLEWSEPRVPADPAPRPPATSGALDLEREPSATAEHANFVSLSASSPSRWTQTDSGQTVPVHVQRAGNPLGNGDAAVAAVQSAIDAWNHVGESRVALELGNDDFPYTSYYGASPSVYYTGFNVVLFDDPYEVISDPVNCSGVLAIGGYWRSASGAATVNNVGFFPAIQLYVVFNDGFECLLGNADNLAEIATHELGHGLGLGHSAVPDAIMRSYLYGNRGPRLGDDDRDAAHCFYPHTITITSPAGGEVWETASTRPIRWSSTPEVGPDAGTVALEYAPAGTVEWVTITPSTPNDGAYDWTVPAGSEGPFSLRVVRYNRLGSISAPFPAACSLGTSAASFSITAPAAVAGTIRPGPAQPGLLLARDPDGSLELTWGASCSADASDYAIYSGDLAALREHHWDTHPVSCSAGLDRLERIEPEPGDRFYLVAPLAAAGEGLYGATSAGLRRPSSTPACATREASSDCE